MGPMSQSQSVPSGRICPCGCGKLARPGDPGFGQRMTIFGKSGYWRRRCIRRERQREDDRRRGLITYG